MNEQTLQKVYGTILANKEAGGYTIIRAGNKVYFGHHHDYLEQERQHIRKGLPVAFYINPLEQVPVNKNPHAYMIAIQKGE